MLIITPLIDRLFLPLFEPDSNSRGRGQFEKLPTMVLFATPAPQGAGPMTISGYAWGHIVATGSMKGLSRKKFHLSRQKLSAASHSTHPKALNANHHASY